MYNSLVRNIKDNKYVSFILLILISFAIYLSFVGGYGSDEDTLPMISVFDQRLQAGRFISSRFTGYPIPEMGIGFLAYYFGSWAANIVTFLFFLIGIIFFYLSQVKIKEFKKVNFSLFFLLCLSSPILYFDNLEPIDYSWAFLFFSLGLFFLSRNKKELAVLFFAFCLGCRLNFIVFIILVYYFFNYDYKIKFFEKTYNFLITFILGGLFYLPVWFYHKFGLEWLTAARPLDQGYFGLLVRFLYKTNLTFGILQSVLILYIFFLLLKKNTFISFVKKNNFVLILIISNLFIFFYIPAELSYMQPALIFFYFLMIKNFNLKTIYFLIFLNFLTWFLNIDYLEIKHKKEGVCEPKNAISATFNISLKEGYIKKYIDTRSMINCWINMDDELGVRISKGLALKSK